MKSFWNELLEQPDDSELLLRGHTFVLVARDVRFRGIYEDIVWLGPNAYGAINRRTLLNQESSTVLVKLYWAVSTDAVLRAVYGQSDRLIECADNPPRELLLAENCVTYGQVRRYAAFHAETLRDFVVRDLDDPLAAIVGVGLDTGRLEYYFVCPKIATADEVEWESERISVVGLKPQHKIRRY
jgi:hypothetical protein